MVATKSPRPEWLKVKLPGGESYARLKSVMRGLDLHTVCEEARCPNVAECWGQGTATFMILGDVCTRSCGFCAVTTGLPTTLDFAEADRVANAVKGMKLQHAVITSVNRDELPDGGAFLFARTVEAVRRENPGTTIEVLIPDFKGSLPALERVLGARPEILAHNVETVPRLYKHVRPGASFPQSVELLHRVKTLAPGVISKAGIMVGLGENHDEILDVMKRLVTVRVEIFTIGQYLQPTNKHLPVERFYHPDEFRELARMGLAAGLRHVESGPLVRSSYHAANQIPKVTS
jgi:lipoic acid synthetase